MMQTTTMEIDEAQSHFAELLKLVTEGAEVLLTDQQQPVVRLSPIPKNGVYKRIAGLHLGAMQISDDFDAPLPDEFWLGEA